MGLPALGGLAQPNRVTSCAWCQAGARPGAGMLPGPWARPQPGPRPAGPLGSPSIRPPRLVRSFVRLRSQFAQ